MTSGALRKDLEASSTPEHTQPEMAGQDLSGPELQLQEIEFENSVSDSMPSHMLDIIAEDFLDAMK